MTKSQQKDQEAIWQPNQADKTLYDLYFLNGKKLPFKARKDSWKKGSYIEIVRINPWERKNSLVMAKYSKTPEKGEIKRNDAEELIWRILEEN